MLHGWILDVAFLGKNDTMILPSLDLRFSGCAPQFSTSSTAFTASFFWRRYFFTDGTKFLKNQSLNRAAVIHSLLEWSYKVGKVFLLTWWRHLGFSNFPMISGCSMWEPVVLQQNRALKDFYFVWNTRSCCCLISVSMSYLVASCSTMPSHHSCKLVLVHTRCLLIFSSVLANMPQWPLSLQIIVYFVW